MRSPVSGRASAHSPASADRQQESPAEEPVGTFRASDLDYEARSSYMMVVTVTDPFGATDSIAATICVTDEDDPAVIRVK